MNLFVVMVVLLFNTVFGDPVFKDYIYSKELNAFYKFYERRSSFTNAAISCLRDNANLLVPTSNFEINFIMKYHKSDARGFSRYYWIGVNNLADVNRYLTIDNSDSTKVKSNWIQNKVTNYPQNCVSIILKWGIMVPVDCGADLNFICKKSWGNPNFTEVDKPSFRSDYYYEFKFKSFYKHYNNPPLKFSDALLKCIDDGAQLYIPRSDSEAEFVKEYFNNYLTMIGVHDMDEDGKYEAIDGSDVSNTFKVDFGLGKMEGRNCLLTYPGRQISYIDCEWKYLTVCRIFLNEIKWDDVCKTYIPGYQYDNETGLCYKYYLSHEDWYSARNSCEAHNATLLFINYERKVDFIRNLVQKEVPSYEIEIWLTDIKYNKSIANHPNENQPLHCSAINRDLHMTYRDCGDKMSFICEMDIPN